MLNTEPRLDDAFYAALLDVHDGLTTEQSHALHARLVLLLANHIGSPDVLREAMQLARPTDSARTSNPLSQP